MLKIAVSACLLGDKVRYDGAAKATSAVHKLADKPWIELIKLCPEVEGGLSIPRPPAERKGAKVLTASGADVSEAYYRGAELVCQRLTKNLVPLAVLKEKSPACGTSLVYDGSHSNKVVRGQGVLAERLREEGIALMSELDFEKTQVSVEHPLAIVLGSGLGSIANLVKVVRHISYSEIEDFPRDARPTPGHSFEAIVGELEGVPVVVYPGRVHMYQGYDAAEVTSLVRHAHKLGCESIILTCASSAVAPYAKPGIGLISDHVNVTGQNPLSSPRVQRYLENPFVEMNQVYSPYLQELAKEAAKQLDLELQQGIYTGFLGPSFETPAEIEMARSWKTAFVGMSMVNEAIMARALGMQTLALTVCPSVAGDLRLSREELLEKTRDSGFEALLRKLLKLL